MDFETAKSIYASLARKAGKTAQTDVDTGIWRKAIDMATGGIYEHNGANVALPYGVSSSQFASRVQVALDHAFNSSEIAGAGASGTMKAGKRYEGMTTEQRYHQEALDKQNPDHPDTVKGGQLSRGYLHDLPLETIGHGQYRVVQGTSYVVNDAGFPLVLDLRKDPPAYRFETAGGSLKPQNRVVTPSVPEGKPPIDAYIEASKRYDAAAKLYQEAFATGTKENHDTLENLREDQDKAKRESDRLYKIYQKSIAAPLSKQQMKRDRRE